MTTDRDKLITAFIKRAYIKFDKGEQAHGGNLENKPCDTLLGEELEDIIWYYLYGKAQREQGIALIDEGLAKSDPDTIRRGRNMIATGNEEGKEFLD